MTLHIWLVPKFSCELIRNFIINAFTKKKDCDHNSFSVWGKGDSWENIDVLIRFMEHCHNCLLNWNSAPVYHFSLFRLAKGVNW